MNDSLTNKFQSNSIIRNGLLNPKCVSAMQLLQQNPKEAQKKFAGDVEVEQFMIEFSKIMADHFTELGNKSGTGSGNGSGSSNGLTKPVNAPLIQPVDGIIKPPAVPIGTLHQEALNKNK